MRSRTTLQRQPISSANMYSVSAWDVPISAVALQSNLPSSTPVWFRIPVGHVDYNNSWNVQTMSPWHIRTATFPQSNTVHHSASMWHRTTVSFWAAVNNQSTHMHLVPARHISITLGTSLYKLHHSTAVWFRAEICCKQNGDTNLFAVPAKYFPVARFASQRNMHVAPIVCCWTTFGECIFKVSRTMH